jgi:hypothetical protein
MVTLRHVRRATDDARQTVQGAMVIAGVACVVAVAALILAVVAVRRD